MCQTAQHREDIFQFLSSSATRPVTPAWCSTGLCQKVIFWDIEDEDFAENVLLKTKFRHSLGGYCWVS